ncbi:MAG: alpha/beta fold hydrolase [Propionibacteriaceae bacterium]|jgi:pimeloyl-ACP methyl ester carboxylesterase|nr:alpha/beta fold hydrolase [Propionibacteriaceae bacterium]
MKLHVQHIGNGPMTAAFLHGLFGQGRNFTSMAKELGDVATWSLIDLPNHGHSPWSRHFSYRHDVAAVAAVLRRSKKPWTLVGHSLGGKVAMLLALTHPQLVSQLVVLDTAPRTHKVSACTVAALAGLRRINLARLATRAEADELLTESCPDRAMRALLLQNLRREQVGWSWGANFDMLAAALGDIACWPEPKKPYQPFTKPTLWITGQRSSMVEDGDDTAMEQLFPELTRVVVPVGHLVHAEAPEAVATAIRGFIA